MGLESILLNITKPFGLSYVDSFQVSFILKHNMDVFLSGKFSDLPTLPIFYGFKNSLFFSNHFLLHSIMALPIYILTKNIIVTFNLFTILTIVFSFFSMYLLAFHLTRKTLPSIAAGIIFVFNPFVSGIFPDSLELFSLQWIPLIFLFLEKSLTNPRSRNVFLFFLFLTCQLLSSLYYAAFLSVLLPIYIVLRLYQTHILPVKLFNRGAVGGLLLFGSITGFLAISYGTLYGQYSIHRDLEEMSVFFSPYVLNWFITGPSSLFYGALSNNLEHSMPQFFSIGRREILSFFWGIVPILLFLASFRLLPRSKLKHIWLASLLLIAISFLLSLGPDIHITDSVSIPGPYRFVHAIDPLFTLIRVPARIAAFVFFFLGLIIAMTLAEIVKKLPAQKGSFLLVVVISLIFFEYINQPLQFTNISPQTQEFYASLASNQHIKVILDLPIGNLIPSNYSLARNETLDSHYMLWAMFHNKALLNGYSSFLPEGYWKRTLILSVNFPTVEKLEQLRKWGVDGIVLHKDEFREPQEHDRIKKSLITLGIPLIRSTETLSLFDISRSRLP